MFWLRVSKVLRPLLLCLLWIATPVAAQESFDQCLQRLDKEAERAGISARTRTSVLQGVQHLPRVIELDRKQPEFTSTFTNYFSRRVSDTRIKKGRAMLAEHRVLLAQLERRYGVAPQYLVAIWGLETNFGGYLGTMQATDALATLACDERRRSFFSQEFVNALKLIDRGDGALGAMPASWAGALGHVQFMPSSYLSYARDGDGDGRRDLWSSIPDALHSAANYLSTLGWQAGYRWGREVRVPDDFDYGLAGLSANAKNTGNQKKTVLDWAGVGVKTANGSPLPAAEISADLLVPSGAEGPAFLAYDNFRVIMKWNASQYYALAVGHLADRISGAGGLYATLPADTVKLTRSVISTLQEDLQTLGHDPGGVDGIAGRGTRAALRSFQRSTGRLADGHVDAEAIAAVRAAAGTEAR